MIFDTFQVSSIDVTPFTDQKPGTSGLRKKVKHFQQKNYLECFIQSIMDVARPRILLLGGDGRYFNLEAIQTIIRMSAANDVQELWVAKRGLSSTPAMSCMIRKYNLCGGIILTASHNAGGENEDFGVKYNGSNGAPIQEILTSAIFERSVKLKSYKTSKLISGEDGRMKEKIIIDNLFSRDYFVENNDDNDADNENKKKRKFTLRVVDGIEDYYQMLTTIFDMETIQRLIESGTLPRFHGMSGVMGPYILRTFGHMPIPDSFFMGCEPKVDFDGGHPDPNLVHAHQLIDALKSNGGDVGFAFDGDGDRMMVLGRNGYYVNPCDSLAVIADNLQILPAFKSRKITGFARSMPTSSAIDRVAKKKNVTCFVTPTGWKYFGDLMDGNRVCLCGEESFGLGFDTLREKDGLGAALAWLSIMAFHLKPIDIIMKQHWLLYGRNYFSRYDYENCSLEDCNEFMSNLEKLLPSLEGRECEDNLKIMKADSFTYLSVVTGYTSENNGLRIFFDDSSRIVYRLSGTGSTGGTVRIYIEKYIASDQDFHRPTEECVKSIAKIAIEISQLEQFLKRKSPSVIT
ncbi:hypothetical protein SNEBB_003237 [Seison nebaliae]|nr:hypothetical protein SNEBB_003237 [Seison nebaliae]